MTIKTTKIITAVMACLLWSALTLAAVSTNKEAEAIKFPYSDSEMGPCGVKKTEAEIDLLPAPSEVKVGDIAYVTGGVCLEDVTHMKNIANNYPLEIVLVEKTEEYDKESYIADVHVIITNAEEAVVLDVRTEGPFLLVNLPDGEYQVSAEYRALNQTKMAKVAKKKHQRIVFLWADPTVE